MKEIKASDLRIGNYFNQFGHEHQVTWETLKSLENAPKDQLWCKPIPLTEEWLERFGFRKIKVNILHNTFNSKKISILQKIKDSEFWYQDTKIESVHHLQNIVHALTGEELAINNQGHE